MGKGGGVAQEGGRSGTKLGNGGGGGGQDVERAGFRVCCIQHWQSVEVGGLAVWADWG